MKISIIPTSKEAITNALKAHYEFLESFQWSLITFFLLYFVTFVSLHVLALRDYRMRKKRVIRDHISIHVDEKEGGDADYLVSIMTSRDYENATTAVTTVRLIGRVLPGRVHDIARLKRDHELSIFAPLCQDKIILKEDLNLDPIVGVVIKTNQAGKHPTWNCKTIIVRNLKSNEAWFFKVKNEIGFARTVPPTDPVELITLNFCLVRRLRQEWRNGQHVIFGLYFADRLCVYTQAQRIVVAVAVHIVLMCFTMMGLSITMPYSLSWEGLKRQMTRIQKEVEGDFGVSSFGLSLEGETGVGVWFEQMFPSALLASFVSTMIGFIMVSLFRERDKYEVGLSEMDYVMGTALRKLSSERRHAKERAETLQREAAGKKLSAKRDRSKLKSSSSQYPPRESIFEPAPPLPTIPSDVLHKMKPHEARAYQRYLFIGGRFLNDPRYATHANFPNIKPPSSQETHEPQVEPSGDTKNSSTDSGSTGFYSEVAVFDSKLDESESDFGFDYLNRQVENYLKNIPDVKLPKYLNNPNQEYKELDGILPGEKNPAVCARPWYKPQSAWLISSILLIICLSGFAIMTINGPASCVHPGLFTMIFITTYLIGLFIQNFIFENVKICLVALYYAYNDRILYKYVVDNMLMPPNLSFQYRV